MCQCVSIVIVVVLAVLLVLYVARCNSQSRDGYLIYGPYNDLTEIGARGDYYAMSECTSAGPNVPGGGWA